MDGTEILLRKSEGLKLPDRPERNWGDINVDLRGIQGDGVDWIGLARDRDRWRAAFMFCESRYFFCIQSDVIGKTDCPTISVKLITFRLDFCQVLSSNPETFFSD
jgi:hypothetical protein